MPKLRSLFSSLASMFVIAGCAAATTEPDDDLGETEGAATSGARSVALKYEGTCEFLRSCSSYSKNLAQGQVTWGCTGVGACDDDGLWVAGPTKSYCNKKVTICKGSRCTNATVKDISVSRDWEASNGVLDALGLPHGLKGKCSGFGGGSVTIDVGGSSSTKKSNDEPDARNDDGCWSNTLSKDVADLACVQSRPSRAWFQCNDGKWYRGVEDDKGPYGPCAESFAL